ncbi:glycoside hydrolase family 25 protein [Rhizobiaceae bacterium BDR2-2]|uniref:Glycoside hydrolase family 25 protein n=1 Tax=Ectorhizobium quercum TaxID=2965071 RepID=A0AAE3SXM6_9HYPH|nr:GH25 family lysozyme [Ectorhizobium quercum]MCX8999219.1 glycoside hydrolase family 25 protein [Ectorhizobium quercum]
MRLSVLSSLLIGGIALAGCRSSSPADVLAITPSRDITSSVTASAPVPSADVGAQRASAAAAADTVNIPPKQEVLAWAGSVPQASSILEDVPASAPKPSLKPTISPDADRAVRSRMRIYSQRFGDAKPINFGKVTPRHYAVHGVDVSRWQGEIDWPRLRAHGANFAYIKATDGGDHLDPMFQTNWRRAKEAGLKRGAYHFFYWCRVASEQASWFIRNVPRDPDALPPVIDVEWNGDSACKRRPSPQQVREKMQVFMDMLERHYGKRPVIYTAPDFYADNLKGAFQNYPFWLRAVAQHPSKVYPGRKWVFWQYSGSGLSQGVNGKIDLNVFHGSESEWHRWLDRNSGA